MADNGMKKPEDITIKVVKYDPEKRYKKPLLIYPPGGRPLENWNAWRRHV